jgi:Lrp/AsnC family transcriptional regulator for asnA, asnC and gidA
MYKTDSIDEQIVRLIGQDGRQTSEQIAKILNISAATVRRRIKRLVENNMMHFVAVVDPADFGFPLPAVIAIDIIQGKQETVVKELSELPEVKWLASTVGRYDILAGTRFRSINDLTEFVTKVLPKVDGVKDIETFICLKGGKDGPRLPLT